jgi:very-short-patch-repair endonuclease
MKTNIRLNISELHKTILDSVSKIFPSEKIETEKVIQFDGRSLYLDIYIPKLKIAIECDGEQHGKFSKFFHGTVAKFNESKANDDLKNRYCNVFGITLVRVQYNDKLDETTIKKKITEALKG